MKMIPDNHLPHLNEIPLFQALSPRELTRLQTVLHLRTFSADTVILDEGQHGDGVYFLLSGTAKIYLRQEKGAEVILNILGPHHVLGEISAVDHKGHSASVVTLETCRCLWMEEADFAACRRKIPALNNNLVSILTERLRRLTTRLEAIETLDTYGRVAYQLLLFAQDYGQAGDGGEITLPLRLTQSDLAGLVGASRERVNRVMTFYKRHQYLSVDSNFHITLHNAAALSERCQAPASDKPHP
ncbi:MAG: Crp/Fnr family transcriptional regulator [Armatimonadota bacterium]|nr:Crp/Fnr family transcriptional regulator [Armatimonadota bacterium]